MHDALLGRQPEPLGFEQCSIEIEQESLGFGHR